MEAARMVSFTDHTGCLSVETTDPADHPITSLYTKGDDSDSSHISLLELAIEKVTAERDQIKVALREQQRAMEALESFVVAKADAREKDLRYFLAPRPVISDSESPSVQQSSSTIAPILSTVPAVRPVPTLIGGTTKCASDGLLGPAHLPLAGQGTTHTGTTNTRLDSRKLTDGPSALNESDEATALCSKALIDSTVNLVLARLRRAQNNCNALVATSQTDLQSFAFTQNSQNGKRIMMRVRVLEQENEELANVNRTGRAARLETEITLRQRFVQDLKQTYSDMEYLVEEVENETEFIGNSLLMLQHRFNLAKATAQVLAAELEAMEPGKASELLHQSNCFSFEQAVLVDEQAHLTVKLNCDEESLVKLGQSVEAQSAEQSTASCMSQSPNPPLSVPPSSDINFVCEHALTMCSAKRRKDYSSDDRDYSHTISNLSDIHPSPTKRSRNLEHQVPVSDTNSHISFPNDPIIPVDGPQRTFTSALGCDISKEVSNVRASGSCIDSDDPLAPSTTIAIRNPRPHQASSAIRNHRKHSRQSFNDTSHDNDVPSNGQVAAMRD